MRVSILAIAFFPPFRAFCSASSTLFWQSFTWASRSFLSLSRAIASSCSCLSSSANLAASTMARWALSSDMPASPTISSRSWLMEPISCSHFILAPQIAWFVHVWSLWLHHAAVAISLFQQGPCLLEGVLVCIRTAVGGDQVGRGNCLGTALLLKPLLDVPDIALDQADVALALRVGSIGVLKGNSKVDDIRVQLLLHAKSLYLALGLCLKGHLHALNGLAKVLPGGGKLLLLLGNPPLDLLLHLRKLQRGPENLVFLLFKSSLCFRQSSLQLKFLSLQTLPDFVNLMDGAAALADLVHDVLDLVGEHLVFSADFLELESH